MKKLVLSLLAAILFLPALVGSAAASVAAAPPAAPAPALFPWVPSGGYPDHFPYGQCTWWAAYNHPVTWSGDAIYWLRDAKAQGVATSNEPSVGAIAVYRAGGLYSARGHVAVVTAVSPDSYTVSEMNAPRWGAVTTRTIAWPDIMVQGFIPRPD